MSVTATATATAPTTATLKVNQEFTTLMVFLMSFTATLGNYKARRYLIQDLRRNFVSITSWAILRNEDVAKIVAVLKEFQISELISMGAGNGYIEQLFKETIDITEDYTCNINAFDSVPKADMEKDPIFMFDVIPKAKTLYKKIMKDADYFEVQQGTPDILKNFSIQTALLLCWPPYNTSMAYDALVKFKGNVLIYIGEGRDGCTGDDKFHDKLIKEWDLYLTIENPTWVDIYDSVFIYKRKQ